jgi:prepilin-type N-terminal cleavage/methylation domain-containing protein
MTKHTNKNLNIASKANSRRAFSLIEIITVMVISSMVMMSTLAIFQRVKSATASVNRKLDQEDVADEILQRIAEDIDRLITDGFDTTVTINNKMENDFNKSQLIIENKFYDKSNRAKTFEKVIWQSDYDELEGMTILYRHHGGLCLEDKILDGELQEKQADNNALFIPLCWGMTLFEIVVPRKDAEPLRRWTSKLPKSIAVSISFAEPMENFDGTLEVADEDRITRYIAVNRTQKMKFVIEKKDFTRPELEPEETDDPNEVDTDAETDADDETESTDDEDETDMTNDNENTNDETSIDTKR